MGSGKPIQVEVRGTTWGIYRMAETVRDGVPVPGVVDAGIDMDMGKPEVAPIRWRLLPVGINMTTLSWSSTVPWA